ncbi:unnamed protein product [Cochlearia groenlandica]
MTVNQNQPHRHVPPVSDPNQNFRLSVRLKYVKLGYHYLLSNALYIILVPLFAAIVSYLSSFSFKDISILYNNLPLHSIPITLSTALLFSLSTAYFITRPRRVFLLDLSCYKPDSSLMVTHEKFMEGSRRLGIFTEDNLAFQEKIIERSGLGQKTYVPEPLHRFPPNLSMEESRKESETVMFGAIDSLLEKTGVKPNDIGILVTNCSLFNPTPSLSAMIVNKYKLRVNILSYNLGGMGCSAGLIAVDLVKQLLQVQPNSYALVVSAENITRNWYLGNERSMLVSNCLFRMGGIAVLLTNRSSDRNRSKYQLIHTVHTHKGADDDAFGCAYQQEDNISTEKTKKLGVFLSKNLSAIAGKALKTNITTLAPLVLPMSEKLLYSANLVARKILKFKKMKPYIPDVKLAFEHFCIHVGGRAVLDEIEKSLDLSEWQMEPSRMTLNRFGNTLSSSIWYVLAYIEAKGRIKKGDRTWQIGFGSGFKCNSAVWKALKTIDPIDEKMNNPWIDEIHEFPIMLHGVDNHLP